MTSFAKVRCWAFVVVGKSGEKYFFLGRHVSFMQTDWLQYAVKRNESKDKLLQVIAGKGGVNIVQIDCN